MKIFCRKILLILLVQLLIVQTLNAQFVRRFELSGIDGQNGLRIDNIDAMQFYGFIDLLIGAPDADNNSTTDSGSVYIIYGLKNLIYTDGFE